MRHILSEILSFRQMWAQSVPYSLTMEQKYILHTKMWLSQRFKSIKRQYIGIRKEYCFWITWKLVEQLILNIIATIWSNWRKKSRKNTRFAEEEILFLQNNAMCHKSILTMAKIHDLFVLLEHPLYSPDLPLATFIWF